MKSINRVKWGIIGCGDVTEKKSGPAFDLVENSKLIAVMRRTPGLAEDYARRHNIPRFYENADELLDDPELNAVYIATPPESHAKYTAKAAEAGKAVYVEKPMGRNYLECLDMIDVCLRNDVPLFVAYYRRALPRFLKVKEIIDNGFIGKPLFVNTIFSKRPHPADKDPGNWRVNPDMAGCGYFCDLASHHLDLLQYYLGPIRKVRGISDRQAAEYPAEDAVSYQLLLENRVQVNGIWNFAAYRDLDECRIVGDRGEVIFSTFAEAPVVLVNGEGREIYDIPHPENIQLFLIESIVNAIRGEGRCPSTGESGAETNRLMDAILDRLIWSGN